MACEKLHNMIWSGFYLFSLSMEFMRIQNTIITSILRFLLDAI